MKSYLSIKISYSKIIFLSFLSILIFSCKENETNKEITENIPQIVTSTITGGDWFNPKTWNEGVIPTSNSDVNITGRVVLKDTAECLNLMIDASSQLIIEKNAVLKVKHHFVNEGIVVNEGELLIRQ